MITIQETTRDDLLNIQALWADGDVMKFVGFPEGLHETLENLERWLKRIESRRPMVNHYSVYEDGVYCGEAFYSIDVAHGSSAAMDIKLFRHARGRGIAAKALSHAIDAAFANGAKCVWVDPNPANMKAIALYERLGFVRKPMPDYLIEDDHLIVDGEPVSAIYMELTR